jgi:hypothetical protein
MVGNVSKVITACAIEDRGTMEAPMFPRLLNMTAKTFPIANVYGDAAYAGVRNYALVDALKAKGWFRFSEHHTGASGGVFGRVFKWADAHEDEFNEILAKRNAAKPQSRLINGCSREVSDTRRPACAERFRRQ